MTGLPRPCGLSTCTFLEGNSTWQAMCFVLLEKNSTSLRKQTACFLLYLVGREVHSTLKQQETSCFQGLTPFEVTGLPVLSFASPPGYTLLLHIPAVEPLLSVQTSICCWPHPWGSGFVQICFCVGTYLPLLVSLGLAVA